MGTGMKRLAGKSVLITGASSGIGWETARLFARRRARVVLAARRLDRLEALAAEIRAGGSQAEPVRCDVTDLKQIENAVAVAAEAFGGVDILVNNAGYGDPTPVVEASVDQIERIMRVNYLGSVYAVKAVLPRMLQRRSGAIVFLSSILGHVPLPSMAAYSATKFAVRAFAESLAGEVAGTGVTVSIICPGAIQTEFFSGEFWQGRNVGRKPTPPGRVARAIVKAIRTGKLYSYVPWYLGLGAAAYPLLGSLGRRLVGRFAVRDRQ